MKISAEDKLMEMLSSELASSIDREILRGLMPSMRKDKIKRVIEKINNDHRGKKEILETYKWIKVKKYIDDKSLSFEDRYKILLDHHEKETKFLIDKIREIVKSSE